MAANLTESFRPLAWGSDPRGTLVRIDDQAAPALARLYRQFPVAFLRFLSWLGAEIRGEIQRAMENDGPEGQAWPERARMTRLSRMGILKQGRAAKRLDRWTRSKKLSRSVFDPDAGGRASRNTFGRLKGAVRYRLDRGRTVLQIGWLNASAARAGRAVATGSRGTARQFQFHGRQPVTPQMRKAFWAAGVPLAADTRFIGQEERPLIKPVYDQYAPRILPLAEARIAFYLGIASWRTA